MLADGRVFPVGNQWINWPLVLHHMASIIMQYLHITVNFLGQSFQICRQYPTNKLLTVCRSHGNTIRQSVSHNNTIFIVCKNYHLHHFRLWVMKFFGHSEVCDFQTLFWDFNSNLKSGTHVSSIAIIPFKKCSPSLLNYFNVLAYDFKMCLFWASVNVCGTHYTTIVFLNKCANVQLKYSLL